MNFFKLIPLLLLCFIAFACSQKKKVNNPEQETYFSVKQFLDDQWKNREGNPYSLMKVVDFNGKTDSTIVSLDSNLWKLIRPFFDEANIGDVEHFGQYEFNSFEEETLDMIMLHYEAINKKAFTRKMDIGVDVFTHRVKSVYIETQKKNAIYLKTQKLLFIPDRIIQIQEYEKSIVSPAKKMNISYYFDF